MINKLITISVSCLLMCCISSVALAFDTRTHVYISQQVINDLQRDGIQHGKVTIAPYGDFTVDADLVSAILANQSVYRMGHVGPDAFPDMVAGQVTVHPGVQGYWQTDDWLKWIMTSSKASGDAKSLAFSHGYIGHAAGDYFAHTYVNWYAGDYFELADEDDLDVEVRHMALEKYIAEHQPSLPNGAPYNLVATDNTLPIDFILNTLMTNDAVADQYEASGTAPHMVYMYKIEREIARAIKDIDDWKVNYVFEWLEKFVDEAVQAQLDLATAPVVATIETTAELLSFCANVDASPLDEDNLYADAYMHSDLRGFSSLGSIGGVFIDTNYQTAGFLSSAWKEVKRGGDSIGGVIEDAVEDVGGVVVDAIEDIGGAIADVFESLVNLVEQVVELVDDVINDLCQSIYEPLESLSNSIDDATNKISQEAARIASLDTYLSALKAILDNWRRDVVRANEEYIRTGSRIAKEVMNPNGNPKAEFNEFVSCTASAYIGVPREIAGVGCDVENFISKIEDKLGLIGDILFAPIKAIEDMIFEPIKEKLSDKLIEALDAEDFLFMMEYALKPGSEANLEGAFALTGGSVNLLKIDDIVERVNADMYLNSQGIMDPDKFIPLYNSVVLSKLSLLDEDQLNELVSRAGVNPSAYSQVLLFNKGNDGEFNILYDGVRSIDGNHAWMPESPPYPRAKGFLDQSSSEERQFGYSAEYEKGFRLWMDPEARDKVFKKVFKGPIAQSIENPRSMDLTELLSNEYAQRNCDVNPFPIDVTHQKCGTGISWLIPVLHILLN